MIIYSASRWTDALRPGNVTQLSMTATTRSKTMFQKQEFIRCLCIKQLLIVCNYIIFYLIYIYKPIYIYIFIYIYSRFYILLT